MVVTNFASCRTRMVRGRFSSLLREEEEEEEGTWRCLAPSKKWITCLIFLNTSGSKELAIPVAIAALYNANVFYS